MVLGSLSNNSQATIPNAAPSTVLLLSVARRLKLSQYWVNEQTLMGERVARYRKYYDGDHDLGLSSLMMQMLSIKSADDGFTTNFMPTVVDTMADRCIVQAIEGVAADTTAPGVTAEDTQPQPAPSAPKAPGVNDITKWAQALADENDLDVLQGDVHSGTIRDANGYVMAYWDDKDKCVRFSYEPAWDGQAGMLIVYPSHNVNKPSMAIKIWQIDAVADSETSLQVTTRMNVYYPDHIDKFIAEGYDDFVPYVDPDGINSSWRMKDSNPIGLPVVHFRNGGRENYGVSELRNALGPQNALNRFHASSVMAAELTAFPIYIQLGFDRDTDTVLPGMIIKVANVPKDKTIDFKKLEGSDMQPLLAMIDSERRLISEITRTPSPDLAAGSGSNKSGEYLKQLEVGLIGKVKRFTNRAGSSWEQLFDLAWRIQSAFGVEQPPDYERFVCRWKNPEVRNDTDTVANAVALDPVWGKEETLRAVSGVYEDLTEERIQEIVSKQQQTAQQRIATLGASLPGFGGGPNPLQPGNPQSGMQGAMDRMMGQQAAEMSRV